MDRSNGLEAKISKEEIRITILTDLQENFLHLIETYRQGPTLHMKTITRKIEDHMISAEISHSIDMMEIDFEMDLLTTRMGTGETLAIFLVPHRPKGETSQKLTPIAKQEAINPTTLRSADLTINLRLALRPMNKNFRKTIITLHAMWFASPQLTKPLTKYQTSVR